MSLNPAASLNPAPLNAARDKAELHREGAATRLPEHAKVERSAPAARADTSRLDDVASGPLWLDDFFDDLEGDLGVLVPTRPRPPRDGLHAHPPLVEV